VTTDNTALEQYRSGDLDTRHRFAVALATAGDLIPTALHTFPTGANGQRVPGASTPSPGKVLLVLETGAMLGLPPVAALQGIQVIEGKATLSAGMMSAVVRRAGHRLHVAETGTVEGGDLKVTATLTRTDDEEHPFTSVWTPHKAARAGLCKYEETATGWRVVAQSQQGKPLPWQAFTEAMCRSRAISEVCRMGAEDALYGVHYTPDEVREVDAELGPQVDAEPEVKAETKPRRRAAVGKQGTKRAAEPTQEEPKPDEPVEAEVVEESTPEPEQAPEPTEPDAEPEVPMYAEVVADVPLADGPTDDSDVPPEEEVYELQSPEVVDSRTGTVYSSQEQMDAALKAERQQREAERTPSAPAPTGEPADWTQELERATTVAQVKAVWDATSGTPALTTDLRMAIIQRKAEVEAEEAKRAQAAQA